MDTEISTVPQKTEQHVVAAGPVLVIPHPTVLAQRAGDEAYDDVLARGGTGQEAAIAYHQAYQAVAHATDCGPICQCPLCETDDPEPGVERPACAEAASAQPADHEPVVPAVS